MVSRLFSSFSGMLISPSASVLVQDDKVKGRTGRSDIDVQNDNGQNPSITKANNGKRSQPVLQGRSVHKKSDFDMHFTTAESLDRAIVNKLQSRMNTSIADCLEPRSSESRVRLRYELHRDSVPNKRLAHAASNDERAQTVEESKSNRDRPELVDITPIRFSETSTRESAPVKDWLSRSNVMSHDIPSTDLNNINGKKHVASGNVNMQEGTPEERRSVMYRNSQFNLENSSREALCSESSKIIPSDTMMHLPLFGVPDPSMHRRTSLTSSIEINQDSKKKTNGRGDLASNAGAKKRARSMSPSTGRSPISEKMSMTQIGNQLFESTISSIIEKGGDEFRMKYSSWIWDAFREQLVKLKTLMLAEFNEKVKDALDEREEEVKELQQRYRQKLAEFDSTTENFQKMIDTMYKENQRVLTAKDFVIDKLKKEFIECKRHFEQDLQRQIRGYQTEAEVEKMELQKRNDELLSIMLTDASKSGLEEAFKTEIESLHKMIKTLTTQNDDLRKQLVEATSSMSAFAFSQTTVDSLESQLERITVENLELRQKLQFVENEKEDLKVSYHQEIAKLNRKIQESNTRYDHQLRDAAEELEALTKRYAKEIKDLKQKMASQEAQHNIMIAQVRQHYGSQVESLSQVVSKLRAELTVNRNPATTRFSY